MMGEGGAARLVVVAATGHTAAAAKPADKRRRLALLRLREDLRLLRDAADEARTELRALLQEEATRRLTPADRARARDLRWELERLTHELSLLRERFVQL